MEKIERQFPQSASAPRVSPQRETLPQIGFLKCHFGDFDSLSVLWSRKLHYRHHFSSFQFIYFMLKYLSTIPMRWQWMNINKNVSCLKRISECGPYFYGKCRVLKWHCIWDIFDLFSYTVYETNLTAAAIVLSIIWQFYQIRYTDSRVSILDVHEGKAT